jgi:hypothetical protein
MKISYVMTEKQVEQLAHDTMVAADSATTGGNTYLRVLVTACQAQLGKATKRKSALDDQMTVLDNVHSRFYAAVLRGITTAEIEPVEGLEAGQQRMRTRERNRRATFARTAKSTLAAFVASNGDLRTLDVPTCTKQSLRKAIGTESEGTKEQAAIERSVRGLVRVFTSRAREHPDEARSGLEEVIGALQETLESLGGEGAAVTEQPVAELHGRTQTVPASRVRYFQPAQLHRGAP